MKFGSVKEYFYKLNNAGYQYMMIPLILFIFFYAQSYFYTSKPLVSIGNLSLYVLVAIGLISVIVLTIVHYKKTKNITHISKEVGLGLKLEKLGSLLTSTMMSNAIVALLMPLGLVITGDHTFSIFFGVILAWYFTQWPTPARVAGQLKLKGDERLMVITRGEAFK